MHRLLSLLVLALLALVVFGASPNDNMIEIEGILRDQSDANMKLCKALGGNGKGSAGEANGGNGFPNTDFQMPLGYYKDNEKDLVGKECNAANSFRNCGRLGADRTPVYAYTGQSPGKNIRSPDTFYTWFHDSSYTRNLKYSIQLFKNSRGIFTYHNESQFPLDGKGWKDYCGDDDSTPTKNHNYGYCWETHFRFGYQGGETFAFTGDDDVWVYINDQLVIDLGSLHQELSQTIAVDSIPGLVVGNSYRFDFFYCERHTTESNMKISTSLAAYCAYYDWCGVCEGNGQSCCTQDLLNRYCLAEDGNKCATKSCGVVNPPNENGCVYTYKNCTGGDKCNLVSCNRNTGNCETKAVVCNDGNACTTDICDIRTGCKYTPKNCDDSNKCTADSCDVNGNCVNSPINCDDGNACTRDTCNPSTGCSNEPITCPSDGCVSSTCNPSTGCVNTTRTCNDNNLCTTDSCIPRQTPNGCSFVQRSCDDNDACTIDSCTPASGCSYANVSCDDSNLCTRDSCKKASGCSYETIICPEQKCKTVTCDRTRGCVYTDVVCNDGNSCTTDVCDVGSGQCQYTPIVCNDNSLCTTDRCVGGSCVFTNITCDDGNKCTTDTCVPATGCATAPVICNDRDDCTKDTCNPSTGCAYAPISCDDGNSCTDDTCKTVGGCQNTQKVCNDDNACTIDTCDRTTTAGCKFTPVVCNDANACTRDSCNVTTGCVYATITCDDKDVCTTDSCDPASGCKVAPVICDDGDKCTDDTCKAGVGCTAKARDCNTGDPCITGRCEASSGACRNTTIPNCSLCTAPTPKDCTKETTDKCFPKICAPENGTCVFDTPINCDDGSKCTNDRCVNGECVNDLVNCNDNNPCTTDTCDKLTGCKNTPIVCNDNSVCTNDTCVNGACVFTKFTCNDRDACTIDTCDAQKGCNFTAVNCEDNNKCTTEQCNPTTGKCDYTPVVCNDNLACTEDSCEPATGCVYKNKECDDKNACTSDSCPTATGVCLFAPLNCTSITNANKCEIPSCDKDKGCSKTAKVCNDNNPCTTDTCSLATGECVYTPIAEFCVPCAANACTWSDSCNPKVCDNVTLTCKNAPVVCNDGSACTTDTCDGSGPAAKCVYTPISCPTTDLCNPASCDAKVGCVNNLVVCNDNNLCTDDSCQTINNNATCVFAPKLCTGADLCNPQTCNISNGNCEVHPKVCDDQNKCTNDKCDVANGECAFELISCTTDTCDPQVCDEETGACVANPKDCDDGNPCTVDTVVCTNLTNNIPTCEYSENRTICDDGDPCTEDICDSSVAPGENPCRTTNVTCPAVSLCYIDLGCVPGVGCSSKPKDCILNATEAKNVTNFCTIYKCDESVGCLYEPRICPNKDIGCYNAYCNNETQACVQDQKDGFNGNFGKGGVLCPLLYNKKAKAAAISAGAVAGIVIGAVAAAAIIGFGGKAGYDYLMAKNSPMGPVASNPLYTQAATAGSNPMYSG